MSKAVLRNRKINVNGDIYKYSVTVSDESESISIYKDKKLIVLLRLSYQETWGINLCRPKAAAFITEYCIKNNINNKKLLLSNEPLLFKELTDLMFSNDENEDKLCFIRHCRYDTVLKNKLCKCNFTTKNVNTKNTVKTGQR